MFGTGTTVQDDHCGSEIWENSEVLFYYVLFGLNVLGVLVLWGFFVWFGVFFCFGFVFFSR